MSRIFFFLLLALVTGFGRAAVAADGIPARPVPFTFVTDQGNLLKAGEAKKLDSGLRRYAETTGTQVVVVTVPSLNGTSVADYGRQLGTAWGVGQRDKNNGIVVLLSAKEHQLTIQPGSGLADKITPALTSRVISQEMTPAFKQGNYFAGLRKGLSSIMLAANPSSDPRKNESATAATSAAVASPNAAAAASPNASLADQPTSSGPADPAGVQTGDMSGSSLIGGLGIGTLLLGAVILIGGFLLVKRLFNRGNSAANAGQAPNFMGNRPNNPTPNFGAPNAGYQQPGYGPGPSNNGGSGMGGILATGAAAAAGAYLGNRLSQNHEESGGAAHNFDSNNNAGLGAGAAAAGTGAAGDYFASRGGDAGTTDAGPGYFSDDNSANDSSNDYFSDNSSYDDTSSSDTGGGGFDSNDDNSGSW